MTHWPGDPAPVPQLVVRRMWRPQEGVLLFGESNESVYVPEARAVELPQEAYLREFLPLDVGDAHAVAAYCGERGAVGAKGFTDLPHRVSVHALRSPTLTAPHPWDEVQAAAADTTKAAATRTLLEAAGLWAPISDLRFLLCVQTLRAVALHHAVLCDLVSLWQYIGGEISLDELDSGWRTDKATGWRMPRSAWGDYLAHDDGQPFMVTGREDPHQMAANLLSEGLNVALSPFHVRVEVEMLRADGSAFPRPPWEPEVNVYQAMCLQLANHIAERAHYKRCAADDCDTLFVRTEGYSIAGQNRLRGNHYCTVRCADRHRQQKHRLRKREKLAREHAVPSRESGQEATNNRKEQP